MDKLLEALKAAGTDVAKQAAALKEHAPSLHQSVTQDGYNTGYASKGTELAAAQTEITTLKATTATLQGEVTKLKANPDTAAIHTQYTAQIADLTAQHQKEKDALTGNLAGERKAKALGKLKEHLTTPSKKDGNRHLNPDYAQVLIEKADVASRFTEVNGAYVIKQNGKDIPITGSFDEAVEVLAAELRAAAPSTLVLVGTDKGGGGGGHQQNIAQQGGTVFDKIREDAKNAATPGGAGGVAKPHGSFAGMAQSTDAA